MKSMKLSLTAEQQAIIQPLFDEMNKINKIGGDSALLAQVFDCVGSTGYLDIRLIKGKTVNKIQKATGIEPGTRVPENPPPVKVRSVSGSTVRQ